MIECHVGVRKNELLNLTKDRLFLDDPKPHFHLRVVDRKNRMPMNVYLNPDAQRFFREVKSYLATHGTIASNYVFQEPDNSGRQIGGRAT